MALKKDLKPIVPSDVLPAVCEIMGVTFEGMSRKNRNAHELLARRLLIYILAKHTHWGFQAITDLLGVNHRQPVYESANRMERQLQDEKSIDIKFYKKLLKTLDTL